MSNSANTTPAIQYHQSGGNGFNDTVGSPTYISQDPFISLLSPNLALGFPASAQITLAGRGVSYAPNTLGQTNHTYSTPNYNDITALARYFADWGASYTIQEGPVHQITVSVAWDTLTEEDWFVSLYASEQWELVPNVGTKSLLYAGIIVNPFLPPSATGNQVILPVALQGALQLALANNQPQFLVPATASATVTAAYASCSAAAQQTFQYMRAGIEGVPSYTQTLKRTAVIDLRNKAGAFQTEIDNFNKEMQTSGSVNFVSSTPGMVSSYPIPADTVAKFMLPSYSKKYGIIGVDPYIYTVYAGWLIKPPVLAFIGRNKLQLTQEFVWDEWAAGLYSIIDPASDFPLIYNVSSVIGA